MPLLALIPIVILTSCSGGNYETPQSARLVLPPVIPYSIELQRQAASEAKAGMCPAHVEFGKDYKTTRDKLRIAHRSLSPKD